MANLEIGPYNSLQKYEAKMQGFEDEKIRYIWAC